MTFEKTFSSCAKINLGLSVPFKYENGYHHIVSLFAPVDICDEIKVTIKPAEFSPKNSPENSFSLSWENRLPAMFESDETSRVFSVDYKNNLMYKAWVWMNDFLAGLGVKLPPVDFGVHIQKKIPSPAGLGGGSSDAAAILRAMFDFAISVNAGQNMVMNYSDLQTRSLELGSDIPFFIAQVLNPHCTALISGTGEIYKILPPIALCGILGIPRFGFSTRQMYQSMEKPLFQKSRDEIIGSLPSDNLSPMSKKTLHDDNSFIHNLYSIHNDFFELYELLTRGDISSVPRLKRENSLQKWIRVEDNGAYLLNNDFIGICQKLFPDKYLILEKIRKAALEKLSQCAAESCDENHSGGKLVSSMSGSGAAIYAGITGANGSSPEFRKKLDLAVASLQLEHPDVHWVKFCTLT